MLLLGVGMEAAFTWFLIVVLFLSESGEKLKMSFPLDARIVKEGPRPRMYEDPTHFIQLLSDLLNLITLQD